jgi:hypothetical protein
MAPATGRSPFERRLARAGRDVRAVTIFLEQACGLLRQLVRVAGWLVLLTATTRLLLQPGLYPAYLIAPGAGALAVLQGARPSRPRRPAAADSHTSRSVATRMAIQSRARRGRCRAS